MTVEAITWAYRTNVDVPHVYHVVSLIAANERDVFNHVGRLTENDPRVYIIELAKVQRVHPKECFPCADRLIEGMAEDMSKVYDEASTWRITDSFLQFVEQDDKKCLENLVHHALRQWFAMHPNYRPTWYKVVGELVSVYRQLENKSEWVVSTRKACEGEVAA